MKATLAAIVFTTGVLYAQGLPQPPPDTVFQTPYAPGEINRIIAASPTVEDLVRTMLVGDDPREIDALVDAIVGEAPMVVASR